MKRLVVVLSLVTIVAGCSPRLDLRRGPRPEARYAEGFMDGYRSAHPDHPFARDDDVLPPSRYHRTHDPYEQGWRAGYATGHEDAKQSE